MPQPGNDEFIKIDDNTGYIARTTNEQYGMDKLQEQLARCQDEANSLVALLQSFATAGIANAQTILDTVAAQPLSTNFKGEPSLSATIAAAVSDPAV